MWDTINDLIKELEGFQAKTQAEVEAFRVRMLGRKGILTGLFEDFRNVDPQQKKELGRKLNLLKNQVQQVIDVQKERLAITTPMESQADDLTKPADLLNMGSRHPIAIAQRHILDIFRKMGFSVEEGPEIEDDWHVFSALNFAPDHPARDMQDTFFINNQTDNPVLLRTHTSSVQVRTMEKQKPPIRVVCPGRVFRNEAISARAHCIFHQVEGLYIDENVSFADLKQAILVFVHEMFGSAARIRLRPSYFPFTEPSAEVDMNCNICGGTGCNICKNTGWLEIMGAGMVDPSVLKASGIDPEKYTGYAFGMGVERIAMLKWQVRDLRLYFENDVRFLEQFQGGLL
ncbi:MAG TPA: phenylalanine--tRNA ligase subunit alpha [Bacteroidales bacterium]|nr:MAG: Phenylalanine--tRNA ligase alpha subunit [Bacteroidetes bacterium ADurb.Bin139]HOG25519.1 phenylalanine--tRNA ligase subunit alpha [Bacteroidales bacterium]HOR11675.1 phenylalanine--tRNA ligase subunit alpha [Bacteroidales bacterium]HOZ19451.1 phenylalanine--tRNA ligase subunit alpha [Bacteroidales bacterium]HPB78336.1 phenylalanine--tRNA ligase subunit alpha [Bacteroidales bacterium]